MSAIPTWRRRSTLGLLTLVAALSYIDRQAFGIFMPQISKDLHIDDAGMGLIAGLSFSVFYILAAFPIARLADRGGDRPLIIAACISVWSLATAACALATNALQMIVARIGLAAGEGGAGPVGQSLLLQIFPKPSHAFVLSVMLAASAVGLGAGGWIGGLLSQHFDWRMSLVIVGLPGLLLALIVWTFAAEPRRESREEGMAPEQAMPLREVAGVLLGTASLRWTALAITSVSLAGFPFLIWAGSFYQTVHGMSVHEAGSALFWPITGGLVLGNLLAGWLAERFGKGRPRYLSGLATIGLLAAFPFGLAMARATDPQVSLAAFFVFHVLLTIHLGPLMALSFAQIPVGMRAVLGASINTVITLCGIGVGTFLVGALSTHFAAQYGDLSLRYALSTVCFSILLGAFAASMAGRSVRTAVATA